MHRAATDTRTGRATVTGDLTQLTPAAVTGAVTAAGYHAEVIDWPNEN